jgi:polyvinyl alcohol dehydrogenase (cytochrome)
MTDTEARAVRARRVLLQPASNERTLAHPEHKSGISVTTRQRSLALVAIAIIAFCRPLAADDKAIAERLFQPGPDAPDAQAQAQGAQIYTALCARCHEDPTTRAPGLTVLRMMAPESILRSLTSGVMRPVVPDLSDTQRRVVAEFLGQRRIASSSSRLWMCDKRATAFDYSEPPVLTGFGLDAHNSRSIAPEVARLTAADLPRLKLKWAFAFPNAVRARSQPTFGGGAIYVGSHDGTVFALDRRSGCVRWTYAAGAEVRTAVVLSSWRSGDRTAQPRVFFGDLVGNVYALDAVTGAEIWRVRADPHPSTTITGAPVLVDTRVLVPVSSLEEASSADPRYECCTFRGSLLALDARTGAKLWQTFTTEPPTERGKNAVGARRFGPSGAAIWNSPSVDEKRQRVYVATGDNYSQPHTNLSDSVLALDLRSGAIVWSYQATRADAWNTSCVLPGRVNCPEDSGPDHDFGAATILAKGSDGQELVLAGQKSGTVYALDPETGALRWKTRVGRGGMAGGIVFGMAAQNGRLFVPVSDLAAGATSDDPAKPGIHMLDIKTGQLEWTFLDTARHEPGFSSVPTVVGTLLFAGAENGRLFAFDNRSGTVLWEFDTAREFKTVNGEIARGGSISGGHGPVAYRGMLFAASGYGFASKAPGNVLLAFGID